MPTLILIINVPARPADFRKFAGRHVHENTCLVPKSNIRHDYYELGKMPSACRPENEDAIFIPRRELVFFRYPCTSHVQSDDNCSPENEVA